MGLYYDSIGALIRGGAYSRGGASLRVYGKPFCVHLQFLKCSHFIFNECDKSVNITP